ncbi:hypothetical protein EHS25_009260 [Saitozyma podzolica]|uniref:TFIIS N-terminal domain-containing protein n=1 Tax=Saitozyma podzolica TaxID=1890683 RepID=A0A427YLE6_9TREE|nr:hypothetical protein EHS25_009260 [Saitozyma podzolica]
MATYDSLFKTIEGYSTMTIEALQYSKIGKVMKKIATLDAIPRNDELRITDRASKLMHEWQEFIEGQANGTTTQANGAKKPESAAAVPAPEKEDKPEEKPEEKKEEVAAEGEKVAEEVAAA